MKQPRRRTRVSRPRTGPTRGGHIGQQRRLGRGDGLGRAAVAAGVGLVVPGHAVRCRPVVGVHPRLRGAAGVELAPTTSRADAGVRSRARAAELKVTAFPSIAGAPLAYRRGRAPPFRRIDELGWGSSSRALKRVVGILGAFATGQRTMADFSQRKMHSCLTKRDRDVERGGVGGPCRWRRAPPRSPCTPTSPPPRCSTSPRGRAAVACGAPLPTGTPLASRTTMPSTTTT
jgi:hypothetical protein